MKQIRITEQSCNGCPMIWECILPDGSKGYIKYRWGMIALKKKTDKPGILTVPIIWEQIGDKYDGTLSLDKAKTWLQKNGYDVLDEIQEPNQTP